MHSLELSSTSGSLPLPQAAADWPPPLATADAKRGRPHDDGAESPSGSGTAVRKVLITGSGTGFGHKVACSWRRKVFSAIARVELWAQVQTLKRQAAEQGVLLQVEKLDVTDAGHQRKALAWDVNILVNNARVGEGGATVGIPAANMRRQLEINVIGPLLLTQGVTKQMAQRGEGRIAWVSSGRPVRHTLVDSER